MRRTLALAVGILATMPAAASVSYSHAVPGLSQLNLSNNAFIGTQVQQSLEFGTLHAGATGPVRSSFAGFTTHPEPHTGGLPSELFFSTSTAAPINHAAGSPTCSEGLCAMLGDDRVAYSVGLRVWTAAERTALSLGWADSTFYNSEPTISLGAAFSLTPRHSTALNLGMQGSQTAVGMGYRYTWR